MFVTVSCRDGQFMHYLAPLSTALEKRQTHLAREGILQKIEQFLCALVVPGKQRPYPSWQ